MARDKVLNVFLASPGDLEPERRAARQVVDDLNRTVGKEARVLIVLSGWEDTLPGAGRPQGLINRDVENCELFVGLMWKRWGSSSGKFSSGFEEEFAIASKRRQSGPVPEIWLAFKQVDQGQIDDPGEQLQKVLVFKEFVKDSRQVLYREFPTTEEWAASFRTWLTMLIVREVQSRTEPADKEQRAIAVRSPEEPERADDKTQSLDLPQGLRSVSAKLVAATISGSLESYRQALSSLREPEVLRLFLALKTAVADRLSIEPLGTHELNALYRWRDEVELLSEEASLIFRTMLAEDAHVHPGWFWFADFKLSSLRGYLIDLAMSDGEFRVRQGAQKLLRKLRLPAPPANELHINDDSDDDLKGLFAWLGEQGDEEHLRPLQLIASAGSKFRQQAEVAITQIKLRTSPIDRLHQLEAGERPSPELMAEVKRALRRIDPGELEEFALSQSEWLQEVSAQTMFDRGLMDDDIASVLAETKSTHLQQLAAASLARSGALKDLDRVRQLFSEDSARTQMSLLSFLNDPPTVNQELVTEFVLNHTAETDLIKLIDWSSILGPKAYLALLNRYFDRYKESAMADVATSFRRIREKSLDDVEKEFSKTGREVFENRFLEIDDFVRREYALALLTGFADREPKAVIELARNVLQDAQSREKLIAVAARVVKIAGSQTDLPLLIARHRDSYGLATESLLASITHLADDGEALKLVMNTATPALLTALFPIRQSEIVASFKPRCIELLHSDDSNLRAASAIALGQELTVIEATSILNKYISSPPYFYNVVKWLDLILYSPKFVRTAMITNLD